MPLPPGVLLGAAHLGSQRSSAQLEGRCRGAVLRHWASNATRRRGAAVVAAVREHMGDAGRELPDDPPAVQWYPIATQLALSRALLEVVYRGDATAFELGMGEDIARHTGATVRWVLSGLGPARALRSTVDWFRHVYDFGAVRLEESAASCALVYTGSPVFGDPMFRLVQALGVRVLVTLCGRERPTVEITDVEPQGMSLVVALSRTKGGPR